MLTPEIGQLKKEGALERKVCSLVIAHNSVTALESLSVVRTVVLIEETAALFKQKCCFSLIFIGEA